MPEILQEHMKTKKHSDPHTVSNLLNNYFLNIVGEMTIKNKNVPDRSCNPSVITLPNNIFQTNFDWTPTDEKEIEN